jgi:filamentous hemagglutinin
MAAATRIQRVQDVLGLSPEAARSIVADLGTLGIVAGTVGGKGNVSQEIIAAREATAGERGVAATGMLGEKGAQFASKTIWKGDGKERIDVENPNPGQRPGQIHYQDNDGNKYLYDPSTNTFLGAPNAVNRLMNDSSFSAAIQKGLNKYLGGK